MLPQRLETQLGNPHCRLAIPCGVEDPVPTEHPKALEKVAANLGVDFASKMRASRPGILHGVRASQVLHHLPWAWLRGDLNSLYALSQESQVRPVLVPQLEGGTVGEVRQSTLPSDMPCRKHCRNSECKSRPWPRLSRVSGSQTRILPSFRLRELLLHSLALALQKDGFSRHLLQPPEGPAAQGRSHHEHLGSC